MNNLPAFNPRSDAPKPRSEPGEGDDVPCVKCGGALDTGLECTECGYDNYEVVTGKPFGATSTTQPADDVPHPYTMTFDEEENPQ